MFALVAKRGVGLVLTAVLASIIVFLALSVLPGDPARQILGTSATVESVEALRRELGLDRPIVERYFAWLSGVLSGDFGRSFTYGVPVSQLIVERAVVSVPLAAMALLITVILALPMGIVAAARRGGWLDRTITLLAQTGIAVPNFWFAIILVQLFAVTLRALPSGGFPGWSDPMEAFTALILPSVSLAIPQAAILTNIVRSSLLDVLSQDFIRTAAAKGVGPVRILLQHALRNGLLPVLTIMGLQFAFLISGVIIIEQVFSLPGLGRLAFEAIAREDLPVVQGVVLCLVITVIVVNFIVDLTYHLAEPRLRAPRTH